MDDDDPVGNALRSRRIPHGKSGKGRGKGKGGLSFNVLKAINEYDIVVRTKGTQKDNDTRDFPSGCLVIRGLTPNEDGLMATLQIENAISGVAILAGSRKDLRRIVEDLEAEEDEEEEDEDEEGIEAEDSVQDESQDGDESDREETAEERMNRLTRTFEKNSFRNPKFWMRWKGHVGNTQETDLETNMGYIVFSGNSCESFEGTLTCEKFGWKDVKLNAHKRKTHANSTLTAEQARGAWGSCVM